MFNLSESIKKTIAIADGYKLGRLVFEGDKPYIELENGTEIEATGLIVEVLNDNEWYRLGEEDYKRKTVEGWPLFAGFDCRWKEV